MAEFFSCPRVYIQSAANLQDQIERIDAIILATEDAMLLAATGSDTKEYRLDDGQTKINVAARSMDEMAASILGLIKLKEYHVQKYNGHSVRLVDHESTRLLTCI